MIETFLEDGGGLVVPGGGTEDDRAIRGAAVVREAKAVDREGLPGKVEEERGEEAEDNPQELSRLRGGAGWLGR